MNREIPRRAIVRLVSFVISLVLVLSALSFINFRRARIAEQNLEYNYLRAVSELSLCTENIKNTLSKGMYSGTPEMLRTLSSKLWKEAMSAKAALSQLPIEELSLENTNKFLSQVGNYALAIAKKAEENQGLSEEEYQNLLKLYEFSRNFSEDMWDLESQVESGYITFIKVNDSMKDRNEEESPTITDGFTSFEEEFDSYPTLIYDGPFSDHILNKEPLLIKGKAEVSENEAKEKASLASGVEVGKLESAFGELGKMPSYCFSSNETTVSVTKNGGYLSYMLKHRSVNKTMLSNDDAKKKAEEYLKKLGIENMMTTYFETYNNVCTINFAYKDGDITVYTDLIKVSVALDDGEILGFDARGYIVNHCERNYDERVLSVDEAKNKLSPLLKVESERVALIPTDGKNEKLTYEFKCSTSTGEKVLVYVNVKTGAEEQILILYESENGYLTM